MLAFGRTLIYVVEIEIETTQMQTTVVSKQAKLTAESSTHLCWTVCTVSSAIFLARILADSSRPTNTVDKPEQHYMAKCTTEKTTTIFVASRYAHGKASICKSMASFFTYVCSGSQSVLSENNSMYNPQWQLRWYIHLFSKAAFSDIQTQKQAPI